MNLVLSLILVRPLGLAGVALGTLIPSIVFTGVMLPIHISKEFGISSSQMGAPGSCCGRWRRRR